MTARVGVVRGEVVMRVQEGPAHSVRRCVDLILTRTGAAQGLGWVALLRRHDEQVDTVGPDAA